MRNHLVMLRSFFVPCHPPGSRATVVLVLSLLILGGTAAAWPDPPPTPANQPEGREATAQLPTEGKSPAPPVSGIELKIVKYPELIAAVKAQRGKVVVVDVWANTCLPCKREFPNLVKLYQEYAMGGLACMSVTVDPPENREAALKFLKNKGAGFANYLLDEDAALWQEKWNVKGVPVVFVFDRAGKRAAKFDNDDPKKQFTYADVRSLAVKLLEEKP